MVCLLPTAVNNQPFVNVQFMQQTNSFPVFILRCLLSRTFVWGKEHHESPRMVLLLNLSPNERAFDLWKQFSRDNGAVDVCKLDIAISSRLYQIQKKISLRKYIKIVTIFSKS